MNTALFKDAWINWDALHSHTGVLWTGSFAGGYPAWSGNAACFSQYSFGGLRRVRFANTVNTLAKLETCALEIDGGVTYYLTQNNADAVSPPPPYTIEDVLLMTNNAGHPTIGGLRVDEIFSECFQQSTTVLDDGRFVYDATAYANDNHSECIGVAQIVLDYKSSNTLDFQAWQVAALPLLSLFFVVYAGLRLGVGR